MQQINFPKGKTRLFRLSSVPNKSVMSYTLKKEYSFMVNASMGPYMEPFDTFLRSTWKILMNLDNLEYNILHAKSGEGGLSHHFDGSKFVKKIRTLKVCYLLESKSPHRLPFPNINAACNLCIHRLRFRVEFTANGWMVTRGFTEIGRGIFASWAPRRPFRRIKTMKIAR